jgi:hypothetical protein
MENCGKCHREIEAGEGKEFRSQILCDDCYLEAIWPRVRKTYYENDPAGFLRRLKESFSLLPQQYH